MRTILRAIKGVSPSPVTACHRTSMTVPGESIARPMAMAPTAMTRRRVRLTMVSVRCLNRWSLAMGEADDRRTASLSGS